MIKQITTAASWVLYVAAFWRQARVPRRSTARRWLAGTTLCSTGPIRRLALQVGNGELAFAVDATGLQTFYGNTMSHWGWHSFPLPEGKRIRTTS